MASNDYQIHWTYPDGERGYGRHRLTKAAAEKICVDANKAEQCEGMTYTVETHNGDEGGKYLNYMEHLTPKVSAKISVIEEENERLMKLLEEMADAVNSGVMSDMSPPAYTEEDQPVQWVEYWLSHFNALKEARERGR